jgi:thiamine biosynthesis lipoprotein
MNSSKPNLKRTQPLLGTFVSIELQGAVSERLLNAWVTAGFEAISEIDGLMSPHRPDSDLSRLNQAHAAVWVAVSPLTLQVLRAGNEMFHASRGIFDIRCVPGPRGNRPAREQWRSRPPVEIEGTCARKTGSWALDLGGIAKGFAVDRAVKRIQKLSAGRRIAGRVNAGGDLRVWGDTPTPLAIRVEGPQASWVRPALISNTAVATSAVRRDGDARFSNADHRRMPFGKKEERQRTVTVFAGQCLWADALTKVVLLGPAVTAQKCLAAYRSKALVFHKDGRLEKVIA